MLKFQNKTLERQFASYKWARNNTLQILDEAQTADILSFTPHQGQHTILYQFQCLITTDDTYYRRLTDVTEKRFGLLMRDGREIKKDEIPAEDLEKYLTENLKRLETFLATLTDQEYEKHIQLIQSLFNHEYLHQGRLIVMFRTTDVDLPKRFTKAFDL